MNTERLPVFRKVGFMTAFMFTAGNLNAYGFNMFGTVAGAHTGDFTKTAVSLAKGDFAAAGTSAGLILFMLLGVAAAELIRLFYKGKGDWRKISLVLVACGLAVVAFAAGKAGDAAMKKLCSFIAGHMLDMFRDFVAGAMNSTISTGNLRTWMQYLVEAAVPSSKGDWKRFGSFTLPLAGYFLGAFVITLCCSSFGGPAAILPAAISLGMFFAMLKDEKTI